MFTKIWAGAHPPHVVERALFEAQIGSSFSNVQIRAFLVVGLFRSPTYRDISVTGRRSDDFAGQFPLFARGFLFIPAFQ